MLSIKKCGIITQKRYIYEIRTENGLAYVWRNGKLIKTFNNLNIAMNYANRRKDF